MLDLVTDIKEMVMPDEVAVVAEQPETLEQKRTKLKVVLNNQDEAAGKIEPKSLLGREERYRKAARFLDRLSPMEITAMDKVLESNADVLRKSGEPAVYHSLSVARILKENFRVTDENIITAAILHDDLEDLDDTGAVSMSREAGQMKVDYNATVAKMVFGLTKYKYKRENKEGKMEGVVDDVLTYKNVLREARENPGILLIKLADRLHNWETIDGQKKLSKRAEAATETLEFFLPIAREIGVEWVVKKFEEYVKMIEAEVEENNKNEANEKESIDPKNQAWVTEELKVVLGDEKVKDKLSGSLATKPVFITRTGLIDKLGLP